MKETVPGYIKDFCCYQLRVRFRASEKVSFNRAWYFEPRYDLGVLLKRSQHSYLFDLFFRNSADHAHHHPTSLVIKVADFQKKTIKAHAYLDIILTVVTSEASVVEHLYDLLPLWNRIKFLKKHGFKFVSTQMLDPKSNAFVHKIAFTEAKLDYHFFSRRLIQWNHHISVNFTTPTTFTINNLLTDQIPYATLINRLSHRIFLLAKEATGKGHIEEDVYQAEDQEKLRLSELNLPKHPTYKEGKSYNMAGVLGSMHYQVPYSLTEDYLLTIGRFIHIGLYTMMGNGHVTTTKSSRVFFDQVIQRLHEMDISSENISKEELIEQVKDFTYAPSTYKIIKIPKGDGSYRQLNIPHPHDLQLQKICGQVLSKNFNNQFLSQNYAYRKGKGAVKAINQIQQWKKESDDHKYVIRCDIDNFFDTISINKLINRLRTSINDPYLTYYVQLWIQSGLINHKNEYELNQIGIPQGSALSPLLANVYLHAFDTFIAKKITTRFVRYADDIILLIDDDKDPLEVLQSIRGHLLYHHGLHLNKEFFVGSVEDAFSFLGIQFSGKSTLHMNADKMAKLPDKIINALHLSSDYPEKLKETTEGLKNYYGRLLKKEELIRIDDVLYHTYEDYLYKKKGKRKNLKTYIKEHGFIIKKYEDYPWSRLNAKPKATEEIQTIKPLSIDKKLKKQRKKHLKRFAQSYELVVIEKGSFIGVSKSSITVKHKGKIIQKHPVKHLRQISIMGNGISTSSNLTKICVKHHIQIMYYDHLGKAIAQTNATQSIKPQIVKAQLALPEIKQGLFCRRLVKNKVKNQVKLLKYYHKYYQDNGEVGIELEKSIQQIKDVLEELPQYAEDLQKYKNDLFLYEARCASIYWSAIGQLCRHKDMPFEKREQKGTQNIVNQMLNYGYAILESKVLRTLQTWQMDPTISYLHSSRYNKPSLCYDLMEQYRVAIVDRSIMSIIGKREHVEQGRNGLLSLETRKKIIAKINDRLFALQKHGGVDKSIYEIMQWQTGSILSFIQGDSNLPKFYNSTW